MIFIRVLDLLSHILLRLHSFEVFQRVGDLNRSVGRICHNCIGLRWGQRLLLCKQEVDCNSTVVGEQLQGTENLPSIIFEEITVLFNNMQDRSICPFGSFNSLCIQEIVCQTSTITQLMHIQVCRILMEHAKLQ